MSALAHSQNQRPVQDIQSQGVTSISAVARVDYILRFSKHAVLVVDEEMTLCSSVGSQYLANLSENQNAAYISMSAKLNNLQVRCRIIEQLFGSVLFDPEQSIAISLINLVKQHKQVVSIVIDNAHHLSLQLIHELTQLAEIAKKSNYQINILMLALPQAGITINQHQSIFHKKLSIVSAKTGQLISHNDKLFKPQITWFALTPFKKWMAFFVCLVVLSATAISILYQRDVFSFTQEIPKLVDGKIEKVNDTFVSTGEEVISSKGGSSIQSELATSDEIFLSITSAYKPVEKVQPKVITNANPQDIMQAIQGSVSLSQNSIFSQSTQIQQQENKVSEKITVEPLKTTTVVADEKNEKAELANAGLENTTINHLVESKQASSDLFIATNIDSTVKSIQSNELAQESSAQNKQAISRSNDTDNPSYFQNYDQGFVIQIAAFSQVNVLAEFLADYGQLTFYQYQRFVNDKVMTVLTSQHYLTREQAEEALTLLPERIKVRSPWIKEISVIKDEINQFQRSQSQVNNVTIPTS